MRIRGRNIHRLLIRRSKHRKQVRQIAQQRNKRKFKLGWISGLLQLTTTNRGSRPEIQDDPGGEGGEGEARDDEELNTTNKELCSVSTSNFCRDKFPQGDDFVEYTNPSV